MVPSSAVAQPAAGQPEPPQYHTQLRAPLTTRVGPETHVKVHRAEIAKVRASFPVGRGVVATACVCLLPRRLARVDGKGC
jgi:hypothetical protein